jgi:hypothetical protein
LLTKLLPLCPYFRLHKVQHVSGKINGSNAHRSLKGRKGEEGGMGEGRRVAN